ncbi:probable WRKY transcription factor 30 [Lycium ferocissimum]|uniref:probable WRKY transcription factor 30 n=1 Tax=Lycium ferocissimum TaxID=112874 RepID=UPI002815B076|nr:probable WRKY transcription factor 30 [Lycium ferocissimum]
MAESPPYECVDDCHDTMDENTDDFVKKIETQNTDDFVKKIATQNTKKRATHNTTTVQTLQIEQIEKTEKAVQARTGVKRSRTHEIETAQKQSTVEGIGSVLSSSSMHKTLAGEKKTGTQEGDMLHCNDETLSGASCISTLSSESVVRSKYPQKKVPESVEVIRLHGTGLEYPDDGFAWKKYGSKEILGSKYLRSYYRCIYRDTRGCFATRSVQRSEDDPSTFEVTYRGRHSCDRHLESSYQKVFMFSFFFGC